MDNQYQPEVDDIVEFLALGDYGSVAGDGKVLQVFKNGCLMVEKDGKKYKTDNYFILSKAG